MPVSKSALDKLKVAELQQKLSNAELETTGLKEALVNRLYEYFNENPTASLEDLEDGAGAPEPDTSQSIAELAIQLKLSQATVDALAGEAFLTT